MRKELLTERLLALPAAIRACEEAMLGKEWEREDYSRALQTAEDSLILTGLDGKNEQTRAAQIRAGTMTEREALAEAERELGRCKLTLHHLLNELSALRAVARMVGSE